MGIPQLQPCGGSQVAAYVQSSYPGRVTGGRGVAQGDPIGVEFMTPAITSLNAAEALHITRGWRGKITEPLTRKLVTAMNPHIEFLSGSMTLTDGLARMWLDALS